MIKCITKFVCSTSILKFSLIKYDKSQNSAKFHKILMSNRVLHTNAFFRRRVCLFNLKHVPLRKLPLTARKTLFSHLNVGESNCVMWTIHGRLRRYY